MKAWTETSDGWRTWANAVGPIWRPSSSGLEATRAGQPIKLEPSAAEQALADRVAAHLADGLTVALERLVNDADAVAWYKRALLAIACVECGAGKLPCLGDCRNAQNVAVPCGSPGADGPRSAGYYQITRGTAAGLGVSFAELQRDPDANHRAAITLARKLEPSHGLDFPTLAVMWNAGSVRPDPKNTWGVHTWSPDLVSRYVRYWNALGQVVTSSSSKGSGGGILAAGLLAALLFGCSAQQKTDARAANELAREICTLALAVEPVNEDVRRACALNRLAGALLPREEPRTCPAP